MADPLIPSSNTSQLTKEGGNVTIIVDNQGNKAVIASGEKEEITHKRTIEDTSVTTYVGNNIFSWYNHYINCYNSVNSTQLLRICCLPSCCGEGFFNCNFFNIFIVPLRNNCLEVVRFLIYFGLAFVPYVNIGIFAVGACVFLILIIPMIKVVINWVKCKCKPMKMMVYSPESCGDSENRFYNVTYEDWMEKVEWHSEITKNRIMVSIAPYREQIGTSSFKFMTYKLAFWDNYIRLIMIFFFWLGIMVASLVACLTETRYIIKH